jgi:hypothetical protein
MKRWRSTKGNVLSARANAVVVIVCGFFLQDARLVLGLLVGGNRMAAGLVSSNGE